MTAHLAYRTTCLTARLTARTAHLTARTAHLTARPAHLTAPAGPPNGLDGPPNGQDGPPNGPDGGAGDRRLRPWYLTRGWIMSHLYMQFGINTVKGRKNLQNNSLERHHKTRLSRMTRIVNENMTFLGNSLKHKNYFSQTRTTFSKNTLRI